MPSAVENSLRASLFRYPTGRGSRESVAGLSELAHPRLEQRPGLRSVNLLPACVECGERFAEPARVRFVDNHSSAAEHAQRVGIELPDVLALAERRDLGVLVDDSLNIGGKRLPCLPIGDQREARPPVVRQAQIRLHLVELEQEDQTERIGLTVDDVLLADSVELAQR